MAKTEFDNYIADEVSKMKGVYMPVKAGLLERLFKKRLHMNKLHPNPEDEFAFPDIGPNYEIVSGYEKAILDAKDRKREPFEKDPIIVEKMHPHGYMILNGHHRWAAAHRMKLKKIRSKIINLPLESDIRKILEKSQHDKRATLDLDEVVYRNPDDECLEKALGFPYSLKYKQRIRLGIPALFYFLSKNGYDIWVYSANLYSIDDIGDFFRCYHVHVDGIVTGTSKNKRPGAGDGSIEKIIQEKYRTTLHIDNEMILCTRKDTGEYEDFDIEAEPKDWAQKAITIIEGIIKNEAENRS